MKRFLQVAILVVVASGWLLPTELPLSPGAALAADKPEAETEKSKSPAPSSWPVGRVIIAQSDIEKTIRAALDQPVEVEFLDTPLEDMAAFFEQLLSINVEIDREALAADGKGGDLPITGSGRYSSLHNALCRLLEGQQITYVVKNDVLLLTTRTAASAPENLSTRLYEVHDLVVMPNDTKASQPDFDSLIELLTTAIRQQDWQDNGGTIGWMKSFDGPGVLALVVTHDEVGHRELAALLKMLREARQQPIFDHQAKQPLLPLSRYGTGQYPGGGAMGGQSTSVTPITPPVAAPAPSQINPIAMPPGMLPPSATNPPTNSGSGFF